jgi:DNA (cytosine-5)-methyltransferase 1
MRTSIPRWGSLTTKEGESVLTHFSLFTGIGGIDLAAEWAGFTTVGQVEWADYPTKVLEKHWPNVPRWRDIHELTYDKFVERTGLRTVDLISGGFPCQPFSVAGKQKGKRDDRYLWPEMLRVIREIKPAWVLGENVPGILSIAGKTVCEDLERAGYAVTVLNFEAAAVGAPHRRDRVFFVAHTKSNTQGRLPIGERTKESGPCIGGQNVADTTEQRLSRPRKSIKPLHTEENTERKTSKPLDVCIGSQRAVESDVGGVASRLPCWLDGYWRVEPNIPRVATGVKNRVDRLKCLGNAVVPQQVYPILAAIAEIERR